MIRNWRSSSPSAGSTGGGGPHTPYAAASRCPISMAPRWSLRRIPSTSPLRRAPVRRTRCPPTAGVAHTEVPHAQVAVGVCRCAQGSRAGTQVQVLQPSDARAQRAAGVWRTRAGFLSARQGVFESVFGRVMRQVSHQGPRTYTYIHVHVHTRTYTNTYRHLHTRTDTYIHVQVSHQGVCTREITSQPCFHK